MQSTDGNSEDTADKAFAELFELFSKPIRSPQNGEPIFTLSKVDRILEKVFEEIFDPGTIK
jgi:hypothetical protein